MDIAATIIILFIILDPFGNIPVFSSILKNFDAERRKKILIRELCIALGVMLLFLFAGNIILSMLQLDTAALRISGGVVLFLVALGMLFPSKSVLSSDDGDEPFIVPIAIPLMAGPSLLTMIMLLAKQHPSQLHLVALSTVGAWLAAATILMFTPVFLKIMGKRGLRAMERLMGMILIMIAVQMLLNGIQEFIKQVS